MHETILKFWFEEIDQSRWWVKDADLDNTIIQRFVGIHCAAKAGELFDWRKSAQGRLAEIIVLDQFSRNMFRDMPLSFAYDSMALVLAQEAISLGMDKELTPQERAFLYMPFMHSESLKIHDRAVTLFQADGTPGSLEFELKHKAIIEKFGRYPHRNAILGRVSTAEEIEFLKQPNSSF